MAQFKIQIAGHVFAVQSLFESTRDYCGKYLTEEVAEDEIEVCWEDLAFEQESLDREAREEGMKRRKFSDPFLERTAIQRKAAEILFDHRVLMLHGSTVAVDGEGYLFTAKCGTGKSTHTRMWREVFGSRARMVNDDKPFLRLEEGTVLACGAPWSGKHGLDSNITVPLRGICILERGPENRIAPLLPEEALPMLLHQGYCPLDRGRKAEFETLTRTLAQQVPLWRMACTPTAEAALTAYGAMRRISV